MDAVSKTRCWFCGAEMSWQSDCDYSELHGEGEGTVTFLSCPNCKAFAEFSHRTDPEPYE